MDKGNKPEAEIELLNIEKDSFEKENLAGGYPELVKELKEKINLE